MGGKHKTTKEELWAAISICSGVDPETVRTVYYGLVKTIGNGLRKKESITLPDLGEFYLAYRMPHRLQDYQTKQIIISGLTTQVKFRPNYKIKGYFKNFRSLNIQ